MDRYKILFYEERPGRGVGGLQLRDVKDANNDSEAWDHFIDTVRTVKECEDEKRNVGGILTYVSELVRIAETADGKLEVKVIASNRRILESLLPIRGKRLAEVLKRETTTRRIARIVRGLKERFPVITEFIGEVRLRQLVEFFEPLT